MREMEIHNKVEQIEMSGDWIEKHALDMGKRGVTSFCPSGDRRVEAYRTGLDLFFQKNGWKDYIVAEEVVTGDVSLQQGFFDRFRIEYPIFLSKEEESVRQMNLTNYQKNLEQFRNLQNAGIEVGYISYLRGALIAMRVRDAALRKTVGDLLAIVNSPTVSEDIDGEDSLNMENDKPGEIMYRLNYDRIREDIKNAENYLQSMAQEKAILGMAMKDPSCPIDLSFSPEEIKRLEFLKRLRREGRI